MEKSGKSQINMSMQDMPDTDIFYSCDIIGQWISRAEGMKY